MENKKGLLLVFLTAVISGFSIFINSYGVKGFDSSVFTFSKNIVVALFLFSIIIFFVLLFFLFFYYNTPTSSFQN